MSENINILKSGELRINNIKFDIPPEKIKIIHEEFNKTTPVLRDSSTKNIKSGQKTISIIIETTFATGYNSKNDMDIDVGGWINKQLAPLLIHARKCPFVLIENEKIRKEVLGSIGDLKAIAAIIKNIQFSSKTVEADLVKVLIHLEIFNYSPFTPDFTYKNVSKTGKVFNSAVPGNLFQSFIDSGTKTNKNIGGYTNSYLIEDSNNVEIIYKEYLTSDKDETKHGWIELKNDNSSKINERIFYKYKRFIIKEINAEESISSGRVVLEQLSGWLKTKTSRVPLQSHSIPTAQFMGAADAGLAFSFFANAEEDENNTPIESSKKISELIAILNQTSVNSIDYHRHSLDDVLYIKHPLANLISYKPMPENRIKVDGENTETDLSKYVAVITENVKTSTVEGMPFCSRLILNVKESHHSKAGNMSSTGIPLSGEKDARIKLLNSLAKKYNMRIEKRKVYFDQKPAEKDFRIAEQLANKARGALVYNGDYTTIYKILMDDNNPELTPEDAKQMASDLLGIIIKDNPDDKRYREYKETIDKVKTINRVEDSPAYDDLMLPSKILQPDYYFWNDSEISNKKLKTSLVSSMIKRHENSVKTWGENISNKNGEEGYQPSMGPILGASNVIAVDGDRSDKQDTDKGFIQSPLNKDQQTENIISSIENFEDMTYTMRRSMPTFRLFFREEGLKSFNDIDMDRFDAKNKSGQWRNFADFYNINGAIDIRLVKDKDNPADLLIIRIVNNRQDIVNREAGGLKKVQDLVVENGKIVNNSTVMLQRGSSIELRLGYDSDPNKLPVEFSGRVASIGGGDIVEIVCQGDGVELVQNLKGTGPLELDDASDKRTTELISDILHNSPEVKSFGTISSKTLIGDHEFFWTGAGGRTAIENIFAPPLFNSWDFFDSDMILYTSIGGTIGLFFGPVGMGIGALIGAGVRAIKGEFFDSDEKDGVKFVIYRQTIWDILQELTLRHPGTVCSIVPFDQRSTIFFGYPEQLYFYKGMNYEEAKALHQSGVSDKLFSPEEKSLRTVLNETISESKVLKLNSRRKDSEMIARSDSPSVYRKITDSFMALFNIPLTDSFFSAWDKVFRPRDASLVGRIVSNTMKPFINYHLVTSEHDIIANNMTVTTKDVYNAIEIIHPETTKDSNFTGAVGFSDYKKLDAMEADDDIAPEYLKTKTIIYHNAHTEEPSAKLPEKYAISTLCRYLNNIYTGKIKILGRPKIKPYDIVFIYDSYNDIFGPIQVKSIVHTLSYETGWVTEITPQLIVTPSQSTLIPYINTMKKMAATFYFKNIKKFYVNERPGVKDLRTMSAAKGVAEGSRFSLSVLGAGAVFKSASLAIGEQTLIGGAKLALSSLTKLGFSVGVPIIGSIVADYVFDGITNWAKYREPVTILPVTRNGKKWYTGLRGMRHNTELNAIGTKFSNLASEWASNIEYIKKEFDIVF